MSSQLPTKNENTKMTGISVVSVDDFKKLEKQRVFSKAKKANSYFKIYHHFDRQKLISGVAYEPSLPEQFWDTPNDQRDKEELNNWWDVAFITSNNIGTFFVHRLDGGAWDRPTCINSFDKFEDALEFAQELNNLTHRVKGKFKTLTTGAVVNNSGILISCSGEFISASIYENSIIQDEQIKNSKSFILKTLEKRKTINHKITSYTLKEYAEKQYDTYISNGAFIIALDQLGFKIKENSINVLANCKILN
jgi:hypothetical protein